MHHCSSLNCPVCDTVPHRYTRIAVGKSGAMDVVSGESSGTSGQLLILYPLLFLLQGTQFSLGAALAWKTHPGKASCVHTGELCAGNLVHYPKLSSHIKSHTHARMCACTFAVLLRAMSVCVCVCVCVCVHIHAALLSREGWLEMEAPGEDLRGMRGVCLTGLLFCFMAVQNFRVGPSYSAPHSLQRTRARIMHACAWSAGQVSCSTGGYLPGG